MKDRFGTEISSERKGTFFWRRPWMDRRLFFQHTGAALGGYFLLPGRSLATAAAEGPALPATARNCIFILMAGGPSHVDTFDLKEGSWTLPSMGPTSYGDIRWPQGLMPKLAEQMDAIALIRSVRSWVLVHGIGQTWVQLGRNPLSGTAKIAPHIGSVVSRELSPGNVNPVLPTFVSLNAGGGPGEGYYEAQHAPFYVSPNGGGLGNTSHPAGQAAFDRRYGLLLELEAEAAADASIGAGYGQLEQFGKTARGMMYNRSVDQVFLFDAAERARYGGSGFGNACIAARNLLRANLGTRFVQITAGGWDMHSAIYQGGALNPANANSVGRAFDAGLGTLIADLKTDGLLNETLIVAMGEFGRTVGPLNNQSGRDHFSTQAVLVAGGGIKGGRVVGETDATGREIVEPGWSEEREIRVEDVEATLYAALGIDYTKSYQDDPLGRGFYLIPNNQGVSYRPVLELW